MTEGVDYAFSQPSASALVAAGKKFACRYGGPGSSGKQLTTSELNDLKAHGIAVVANAEGAAQGFSGATAGRSWAQQADLHFSSLGMPPDRPIYFSVDWNASASDWPGINAALKAAAVVLGGFNRVGVYGGFNTIAHCVSAGTARWFWQTYAWSGGKWHPKAHIQQYRNGVTIGGADCDLNRAMVDDYGQWGGVEDIMSSADVVQGNKDYNVVTQSGDAAYPGGPYNGNEGGRNVWDRQDIPNDLQGKKGPAWQAIQALHKDAAAKNTAIANLQASVDHLTSLLEAHIAGLIEGAGK